MGLLSKCYNENENNTEDMLSRQQPILNNYHTVLLLAVDIDNKKFLAHTACKTFLDDIWTGTPAVEDGYGDGNVEWYSHLMAPRTIFYFNFVSVC